jgi:antitoxin HicB
MSTKKATKPKAKKRRSIKGFTTLDEVLAEDGTLEEFQAVAVKEVLAWQIQKAMKEAGLSRHKVAAQTAHKPQSTEPRSRSQGWEHHT